MVVAGNDGGGPNVGSFSLYVIRSRWFMIFGTILIMSTAGATYMFALYSGDIKESLRYDQTTLNLLSFFKDLGASVGILSGLINEVAPPWVVLSMGAVLNFVGYFMIWLAVENNISKPQVWHMCLYICIGASSQPFANSGALVTAVKNFPESRGVVLGLLTGFAGLSGAIITQLCHAVYFNDSKSLILMISWLPAAISLAFLRTIRIMKDVRVERELKVFYRLLYISIGLAGFLMIMIIIQNQLNFSQGEYVASAAGVVALLVVTIAVVIQEELRSWRSKNRALENLPKLEVVTEKPNSVAAANLKKTEPSVSVSESIPKPIESPTNEIQQSSCWNTWFQTTNRGDDFTIPQTLFSVDMMILFMVTICGVGGTLTAIDNLAQIGKSLGYPEKTTSTFVSLVSIWNYMGRVVAGFVSEYLMKRFKFPRTLMLTLTLSLSCVGHLFIAFGVPNGLYFASIIIGFCFGAQWPLLFAIISELFGLKYFSTLYNFGSVATPIGSYLLNVRVAGYLYDKEANKQLKALGLKRLKGQDLNCHGVECFRWAFIIITGVTIFGVLVSGILVMRTREFYRSDIYKKFVVPPAENEMAVASAGIDITAVPSSTNIIIEW